MTKSSYAEGNRLLGLGIISWCHILFSFIAFGSPKFALAVWLLGGSRVLLVLYLLVLFLPLLSACLAGLWGRKLGSKGASLISCLRYSRFFSLFEDCFDVYYRPILGFSLTALSLKLVVTVVSALVHIYSTGYLGDDPQVSLFATKSR